MFKEFTFKRFDGDIEIGGYRFNKEKLSGKSTYKAGNKGGLPRRVDLRNHMPTIESQGQLNSCVANAVAGAYEYLAKRHEGTEYDVSRLFIYYNARYLSDMETEDEGCYISDAVESLGEYGACSEETYPYDPDYVNDEPTGDAYDEASAFKVESVEVVPTSLQAWKSCLAEGNPIIFGLRLFKSFDKHRKRGVVPMPSKKEVGRGSHGAHAMLCVGYSDNDQVFIVRNSWGSKWGDNGYCYIPYRYMMGKNYNFGDSWIIKQLDNFENYEEDWYDDEKSILENLQTELTNMPPRRYRRMTKALHPYPLHARIGILALAASGADGDISDTEYEEIAGYVDGMLSQLGFNVDTEKVLRNCGDLYKQPKLIIRTAKLMGEYLSKGVLARILMDIEEIAGSDELEEGEERFIDKLIQAWQIEDEINDGDYNNEDEDFYYEEDNYEYDEDYDEEDEDYGHYDEEDYEDSDYDYSDEDYEEEEYEDEGDYEEGEGEEYDEDYDENSDEDYEEYDEDYDE